MTARGTTRVEPLRYSEMRNRYVARAIRPLASFRQPVHTTSPVGIARQCRGPSGPVSQSIDHLVLDRNRSQCWVRSKLGHLLVDPPPPYVHRCIGPDPPRGQRDLRTIGPSLEQVLEASTFPDTSKNTRRSPNRTDSHRLTELTQTDSSPPGAAAWRGCSILPGQEEKKKVAAT